MPEPSAESSPDTHRNDLLRRLDAKYDALHERTDAYLEGLVHQKPLTYWDYIEVETLLSLQRPRTDFPDEVIFITYHQITELYFLLIHQEVDQALVVQQQGDEAEIRQALLKRLRRIVNYLGHLAHSFDVMTYGMDLEQFRQFRMALLPASGFQTASFREIELKLTDLRHLLADDQRAGINEETPLETQYPHLYWKAGNRVAETGEKTLTLRMFEAKYDAHFYGLAQRYQTHNLRRLRLGLPDTLREDFDIVEAYRAIDLHFNVYWRLSHLKTTARYLRGDKGTGGTNWAQYLPPRHQRVVFFPELWTEQQVQEWGREWVEELFDREVAGLWSTDLGATQ